MQLMIYVASPYRGDVEKNLEFAAIASRWVMKQGHIPVAPHLMLGSMQDDDNDPWLEFNKNLLRYCDEAWFFDQQKGNFSEGMREEWEWCEELEILHSTKFIPSDEIDEIKQELAQIAHDKPVLRPTSDGMAPTMVGYAEVFSLDKCDMVNHPKHYTFCSVELIDLMEEMLSKLPESEYDISYYASCLWFTILQYIFRWPMKNGVEDLEKVMFYLPRLIEELKKTN